MPHHHYACQGCGESGHFTAVVNGNGKVVELVCRCGRAYIP